MEMARDRFNESEFGITVFISSKLLKFNFFFSKILITHSQREAYMVLVRNGGGSGSGSGGSGSGGSGSGGSGSGRQLSQNPQAI